MTPVSMQYVVPVGDLEFVAVYVGWFETFRVLEYITSRVRFPRAAEKKTEG